jgi:hypothetical protein
MSVYVREMTEYQLYWLALVQWIKWRWAWDALRALGELLLMMKLVHVHGATGGWDDLGQNLPWWVALLPFFVLDFVALVPLARQRVYPLFRSEEVSLKLFTVLAGFPIGTAFKMLVCFQLDGGYESLTACELCQQ